jgi:hypothetical protein
MVICRSIPARAASIAALGLSAATAQAFQQAEPDLASKLPDDDRARLWLLLLGVIVLAILLFMFIQAWSWHTRRRLRTHAGRSRQGPDNWAARRFLKIDRSEQKSQDP